MKGNMKKCMLAVLPYCVVVLLTIATLAYLYSGIDMTRPLIYQGDGISASYLVKTINDTGWFSYNPYTGGVFGSNYLDYISCDNLSFFIVKIICQFTNNVFLVYNLFYFLTFILVSITSLMAFRALKVNTKLSIVLSLLYSFIAYHQLRISHIWLTAYFMIPLSIVVALWIASDAFGWNELTFKNMWRNKKVIASIIILFLSAFVGSCYYAFFSCCIICVAGVITLLKKVYWKKIIAICVALFSVVAGVIVNIYPSLVYWAQNGTNKESELAIRSLADPEFYGLKLMQLLMPRLNHRIPFLAGKAQTYMITYPCNNENTSSTLGLIGTIGFICLILLLFRKKEKLKYVEELKYINIGVFLIATIGGIGALFSYFVPSPMRCYNRLSLYIAFLCFIYLGIFLTNAFSKIRKKMWRQVVCVILCIIMLFVGLYDQTVNVTFTDQSYATIDFDNDKAFIQSIEKVTKKGTKVFQLPYMKFPSGVTYELFKGYMHSTDTVWSYGGMQGREEDLWESSLTNYSANELLTHLCYGGYLGLYIDKTLFTTYDVNGINVETFVSKVAEILGQTPMISENGRLVFFDLTDYCNKIKSSTDKDLFQLLKKREYKVRMKYEEAGGVYQSPTGFYARAESELSSQRWAKPNAKITITNDTKKTLKYIMTMTVYSDYKKESNLTIAAGNTIKDYKISKKGTLVQFEFSLKPGDNTVSFGCDAPVMKRNNDARGVNFLVVNPAFLYREQIF